RDHEYEEPVAAGKVEPGEGIPRQRRNHDRKDRPSDGDPDRGEERRADRLVVPDALVVLERRQAGLRKDLPPPQAVDVGGREERGEEEPERRNEPEKRDDHEEE